MVKTQCHQVISHHVTKPFPSRQDGGRWSYCELDNNPGTEQWVQYPCQTSYKILLVVNVLKRGNHSDSKYISTSRQTFTKFIQVRQNIQAPLQ